MNYYISGFSCSDELYHFGIPGQKWYVRRFQNPDGTLTPAGKKRYYGVSESTDTGGSGGTSREHYRVQGVGDTVTNAARKTGQAIGKAGKAVVKYETDKFKRRHPWMMSNEELDAQILKAKKVNELRTTREAARGKTFVGKFSNMLWKSAGVGTDKIAESFGNTLGKKYVEDVLFKSNAEKKAKKMRDKNDLIAANNSRRENALQERKNYDDYKKRKKEYEKEKRHELAEKAKLFLNAGDEPTVGSKRAVDEYVKGFEAAEEKERRRKLYGPGGIAYR